MDWLVGLYAVIGAMLFARTWRHRRDGRVLAAAGTLPRAGAYTAEGQRRLRVMWAFYAVGGLLLAALLLAGDV